MTPKLTNLAKDSLIYGLGSSFNRLVSLLALPIFTRYLSPHDFGVIAILSLLGIIYSSIFGLGLGVSTGIVYFQGESDSHRRGTILTTFLVLLCSSAVLLGVNSVFASQISFLAFRDGNLGFLVLLYSAGIALQIMTQPFLSELQYRNQVLKFTLVTAGGAIFSVIAMSLLIIGAGRSLQGWVEGVLVGNAVLLISLLITVDRYGGFFFDSQLARELLRVGRPFIPSFAFIFIIQWSGTYMLQWFVTFEEIGIYGIGYNIGMALGLATTAFAAAWYPFFQAFLNRQAEAKAVFSNVLMAYTFGFGALCFLFFLFAKPVIFLLTDQRYHAAYSVVGIVAVAQFWLGMWNVLLPGMYFARETYLVSLVQGVTAILVVLLNLALIPTFRIEGAALSLALGSLAMVSLQALLNRIRNYQVAHYRWYRPCLLISILAVLIFLHLIVNSTLSLIGGILAGVPMIGMFIWASWLLLSGEERQQVVKWTRSWRLV